MKRGMPQGYTIVEVMIFLAVTGLLFAMIAITFAGQRGRTQFSTAARDVESQMRDLANDVSTGFYPSSEDFTCQEGIGGEPMITGDASQQGTNEDCIFLGRVIQFMAEGDSNRYDVYSVVGLRQTDGRNVEDYDQAQPTASGVLREEENLPAGIEVAYARVNNTPPDVGIGFFSRLGAAGGGGASQESGALSVDVLPLDSGGDMIGTIDSLDQAYFNANGNPTGGMTLCMNSGTSTQHAILTIGAGGGQLTTDLEISNGACS